MSERLDIVLMARHHDFSRSRIKGLIEAGFVKVNGEVAVTHYRVVSSTRAMSCVECVIETGRTHQIRVHMASLGTPVVGDAVYGRSRLDRQLNPQPARQLLHAWRLALKHPITREPMTFEAPVPSDFML